MRGVRLPLPRQTPRVHLTARDHFKKHRPTSDALLAQLDREPDTSNLTPFWDLVYEDNSSTDTYHEARVTRTP